MKCLKCGRENMCLLCSFCATEAGLESIFPELTNFNPETCENPYLIEYASSLPEGDRPFNHIPELLAEFPEETAEYYDCRYYKIARDERFAGAALKYLDTHEIMEKHTQRVLYDLLQSYMPGNLIAPGDWCKKIAAGNAFCCELYAQAARYYSMIGEYDLADELTKRGIKQLQDKASNALLCYSVEGMQKCLETQKTDTERYRTKKPYWPSTEERRRVVAAFYDKKRIKYPRIEKRPKKIKESDFAPIQEYMGEKLTDYCTFWCTEAFSVTTAKDIYQIAAVRVRDGKAEASFTKNIYPWSNNKCTIAAVAKAENISLQEIEAFDEVDRVLPQFFDFVKNDVLVSTDALGNQAKLLSRAARYAGMCEIPNAFYDLLDLAADVSPDFDFDHNTRDYLLSYFKIKDGTSALQKAKANKALYDALEQTGEQDE